MKCKKYSLSTILSASILLSFAGCASTGRAERLVQMGEDVTAIEIMAPRLARKPNDKELAPLFAQIYPYAIEQRIPSRTIEQIIRENLAPYSSNQLYALRNCAYESGNSSLSSHRVVSNIISQAETVRKQLSDIIRIQNAVAPLPSVIGDPKYGQNYQIRKYNNNFTQQLKNEEYTLAQFYYDLGEVLLPGENINQKREILGYYTRANELARGINGVVNKCAQMCYEIADAYEYKGDLSSRNEAISWFEQSLKWVSGYKDAQTRIYKINYDIGMEIKDSARTVQQLESSIPYFNKAGNYKDTATQIQDVYYTVAYIYRNDKTASSYEKAGEYFSKLGSYKNAANETRLYEFYKKLKTLDRYASYNNVSLTSGNYAESFDKNLQYIDSSNASIELKRTQIKLNTFTPSKDGTLTPGAMFDGSTIASLKFTPFTAGTRNPIDFIITARGYQLTSGTINSPASKTAATTIKNAADRYENKIIPEVTYKYTVCYSKEDVEKCLGLGYGKSSSILPVSSSFWTDNIVLLEVTQTYFTATTNAPKLPVDFFNAESGVVSASSLKNVTPFYVSSVDYGRKAYFIITSELPAQEIIDDFSTYRPKDAISRGGSTGKSVSPTLVSKWNRYHTTVNGISVAEKSFSLTSLDSMYKWIKTGIDKDLDITNVVPVSFTLRNLLTNEYAVLTQNEKYNVKYSTPSSTTKPDTGDDTVNPFPTRPTRPTTGSDSGSGSITISGSGTSSGSGSSSSDEETTTANPFPTRPTRPTRPTTGGSTTGGSGSTTITGGGTTTGSGTTGTTTEEETTKVNPFPTRPTRPTRPTTGGSTTDGSGTTSGGTTSGGSTTITGGGTTGSGSSYGNSYSSLVFIGPSGKVYTCKGKSGITYTYEIPAADIEKCVAAWNTSEISKVTINGINMSMKSTVYSFRDVVGNTISLDITDASGNWTHNLLVIKKIN